jgi:hypothetical protein
LNPEVSKLLLEIARCPNVQKCYNESTKYHPCSSIVLTQNVALDAFHLPEPWNGEIDTAPILFISSNPSININEIYPIKSWDNNQVIDNFNNRFGGFWVKVQNNRYHPRLANGTYANANPYWGKVRNHAEKILQREVVAGKDFAITEVVHCKSVKETGVKNAISECIKYLPRILAIAGASVIVVVGKKAESMIKMFLGLPDSKLRFIKSENRYWVFVDHSYTKYVLLENVLSSLELDQIRNAVQTR